MSSGVLLGRAGAALLLIAVTLGGCRTCQPITRQADVRELPANLVDAVYAGYPGAAIDEVEISTGMAGTAYTVWYHVGQAKYRAEFLAYR